MSNVVTFNGVALPAWVKVTGISFPVLPEIDVRESVIPRRFGNVDNGVKFGGKPISLEVILTLTEQDNIQERADELKRWLRGNAWKPSRLIFDEQPNKFLLARVSNAVDIDDLFVAGSGEIEFYSADPTKYAVTETSIVSTTGSLSAPYAGMEKAPAVIKVNVLANCTDIEVRHSQTGHKLLLRGNFISGQTVTLDSSRKLIKVNDTVAMGLLDFSSRWLYLSEGSNTFILATATVGVTNKITVSYRQAD